MACPFFYPTHPLASEEWPEPPLLPMGDPYDGECRCSPNGAENQPSQEEVKNLCNVGYARGRCARFPSTGNTADASRFAMHGDDRETLTIRYVQERGHLPWQHGSLLYSRSRRMVTDPHSDATLNRQVEAYAEAYLRRRP